MNNRIIKEIAEELKIKEAQVTKTLELLQDNNTIPFIARYRKEVTGNLDEDEIRKIDEVYLYQVNLSKKKEDVIRLIEEKGMLTEELKKEIENATKLIEIEDLYRPFKEKKKTKATEAIKKGLEPLASYIMTFPKKIEGIENYLNDEVKTIEEAIEGASHIIAENISDDAKLRKYIREYSFNNGIIETKEKKNHKDETKTYEMYYSYKERVKEIKPHRTLAINRAEDEKIITVNINLDTDFILRYIESKIVKDKESEAYKIVKSAISDSYKRLISPSIEREIRSELTEISHEKAIEIFSLNLEKLLLQPPMKEKKVLGLDPAFRTGCKLAVVDKTGKMIYITAIYPHEPKNEYEKSKKQVLEIIEKYDIDIIAIGNGTASRESESFIADTIKEANRKVEYVIVNEAGASVYSASKLAQKEFPDLQVEQRSAVSIARRLQDPLSELVKIDTKSIGVGQYQHDVNEKKLDESLGFVVSSAVNNVGVNINTASEALLKYVSGLTKTTIDKILKYKDTKGKILERSELKKILPEKTYEQSIGFIRIIDGKNILDKTNIHPESYDITLKILEKIGSSKEEIGTSEIVKNLEKIDSIKEELNIDKYTLEDIIKSLKMPLRDPRDEMDKPLLRSDILQIDDLKIGMKLQGTVRNVVDFGVFIDIGLKNDALAHISKITTKFIKHPSEVLAVGEIVDCYIEEINKEKKKVSLTLIKKD